MSNYVSNNEFDSTPSYCIMRRIIGLHLLFSCCWALSGTTGLHSFFPYRSVSRTTRLNMFVPRCRAISGATSLNLFFPRCRAVSRVTGLSSFFPRCRAVSKTKGLSMFFPRCWAMSRAMSLNLFFPCCWAVSGAMNLSLFFLPLSGCKWGNGLEFIFPLVVRP